jgi:hypothetical protein
MDEINSILESFETIQLKEMEGFELMNRTDTKFTFKSDLLPFILKEIEPYYNCFRIESKKKSDYQNLYYDTESLDLYKQHHNGKLNRYKIRHRTYVDSNLGYLEIKFKSNKGRTHKKRMVQKTPSAIFENGAYKFLAEELPFDPRLLKPTVQVNYSRITLINKKSAERLTIDLNIQFINGNRVVNLDNLVIAEVKQEKTKGSYFLSVMKNLNIRQSPISKYCFALAFTRKEVKKNNFKEKLLALRTILSHDPLTSIS